TSTRAITYCFAIYISGGYTKRFTPEFFKRCDPSIG
ncbi:D-tyrosyl-tRNA(Tyr) deacylase, partial [Haemophilus influenzae]